MNKLAIAVIYVALCAVIGYTVWVTKSALPLFALMFTPTITSED